MHTVPTLVHDKLILNDSAAILIYLTERYGSNTNLLPKDVNTRCKTIDRLMFNSTILFKKDSEVFVCQIFLIIY